MYCFNERWLVKKRRWLTIRFRRVFVMLRHTEVTERQPRYNGEFHEIRK